jgi:hypothetical protein
MDGVIGKPPAGTGPRISDAEMARRREIARQADAQGRIEGKFRGTATDHIFEAFVRGEIEVTDLVPLIKAHYGLT